MDSTAEIQRADGRSPEQLREVRILAGVNPYAEGSAEVSFGNTKLLITATIETQVPKWMAPGSGGWITAEYGMLPRSTHTRNRREASAGKQSGRTLEIQRLIGRSLRAAVDLKLLEGVTVTLDCDVLVADGGTRTAAICGGWVALYQALQRAGQQGLLPAHLPMVQIAAVSLGMQQKALLVDLCYEEDSTAEFDCNLVFNEHGELIELQGTAERAAMPPALVPQLLEFGGAAARRLMEIQRAAVAALS